MRVRPAEVDDVHSEWMHLSRLVVESCTQMSDTGATAKPRPYEAWDRAMRRGTEASADATQCLAKQVATALGVTTARGHKVSAIAEAIGENTEEKTIARRLAKLDVTTGEAHKVGHARYEPEPEPEPVWALRAGRTMEVMAEVFNGAKHGTGPLGVLKERKRPRCARTSTRLPAESARKQQSGPIWKPEEEAKARPHGNSTDSTERFEVEREEALREN